MRPRLLRPNYQRGQTTNIPCQHAARWNRNLRGTPQRTWLNFEAEVSLLPPVKNRTQPDQEAALNTLAALFTTVPWGA